MGGGRERLDPEPLRLLAATPAGNLASALENDLQPPALALRPELDETLATIRAAGALGVTLAGSGPTCFGLFGNRAAAERAAASVPGAVVSELRGSERREE
jgi:4-diphosphocytidyl-2-C-methyl-D-erythritol kinase